MLTIDPAIGIQQAHGLALLFVHLHITLDYNAVIDKFDKSNRRLEFC